MVHGAGGMSGSSARYLQEANFFCIFSDYYKINSLTSEKTVGRVYQKCMPKIQVKF